MSGQHRLAAVQSEMTRYRAVSCGGAPAGCGSGRDDSAMRGSGHLHGTAAPTCTAPLMVGPIKAGSQVASVPP